MSDKKISDFFQSSTPRSKRHRASSSPELTSSPEMTQEKVGELTQAQLMAGLSALLDQKLANLATKEDLANLTKKVEALQKENSDLRVEIDTLRRNERSMMSKLVDLESRSRRNNLIFKGLKVPENTRDYAFCVRKFCSEVLGSDDKLYVNRAHPLGKSRSTIIAHLPNDEDIQYVMSRVGILKNTGYVVHRDFPQEIREKRAKLIQVRAEVERVTGRRRMTLGHDHLVIEGCRFTWDGKLRAGGGDGGVRLQELLGRDFSQFLSKLQDDGQQAHRPGPPTPGDPTPAQAAAASPRT